MAAGSSGPVTVGDPKLRRAGHARVEGHERGVGCEREQARRGAVTEEVVQRLPIYNNFEFRHEIDDRRGPFVRNSSRVWPGGGWKLGSGQG